MKTGFTCVVKVMNSHEGNHSLVSYLIEINFAGCLKILPTRHWRNYPPPHQHKLSELWWLV